MQDFSVEVSGQMFGDSVYRGSGQNFSIGEALKFGGIIQQFALKLLKICKFIEKISEKWKRFRK